MAPNSESNSSFQWIVSILAIIVALIFVLYKLVKRTASTNLVLLTGLSGVGKTQLFIKIVYLTEKKTVISMKENKANLKELNVKLIDIPGADRLRQRYWEEYRSKSKHIVFVLDSTDVHDNLREVSEYLYTILSYPLLHKNKVRITVACNKQDLLSAKNTKEIESMLEKELNAIRATKSGQLEKTSNVEEEDYLHKLPFYIKFSKLNVNFIETSVDKPDNLVKAII